MIWADIVKNNVDLIRKRDFKSLYKLVRPEDRKYLYEVFKNANVNPYQQVNTIRDISWTSGKETFIIEDDVKLIATEGDSNAWEFMLGLLGNICNSVEDYGYLTDNIKKQSVITIVNKRFKNADYPLHFTKYADGSIAVDLKGAHVMYDVRVQDIYIEGTLYQWPPENVMDAKLRFRWDEQ
jgi:hypothetical protein